MEKRSFFQPFGLAQPNRLLLLFFLLLFFALPGFSQVADSSRTRVEISADLVSFYIWRGAICDPSPNIQPTIALKSGNFELGTWGSSNFNGSYREADLFVSYSPGTFTATLNDYIWTPFIDKTRYFDYSSSGTGHFLEGSLAWNGTRKFPLTLLVATMFYGADRKIDRIDGIDTVYRNNFSTYLETTWPFSVRRTKLCPFIGLTPASGYYGDSFGVINLGITGTRYLKLSEKLSFPVYVTLAANPQAQQIFFLVGVSLVP